MSTICYKRKIALLLSFTIATSLYGQSDVHKMMINKIEEVGSFRAISMTRNNGEVVIFNDNSFYESGCPIDFITKVSEYSSQGIIDLQHTDNGNWLIVYGDNHFVYSGVPMDMVKELNRIKDEGRRIISVSFCDIGYWLILVEGEGTAVSSLIGSPYLSAFAQATKNKGVLMAFYLSDVAGIGIYQYGVLSYGNIPSSLVEMVCGNNQDKNFTRVAFSGDDWMLNYAGGMFSYNE